MFVGLVPIMWAAGTGADVMKRIAAPMIGGLLTSFVLELVIYPPLYQLWKWHAEVKHVESEPAGGYAAAVEHAPA
jgi:Cu(I)/Ag(I) efflux system membrane protein CusA/SilA